MIKLTEKELEEKNRFIEKYMGIGNPASMSEVDANANVENKNIATMDAEIDKDIKVQINRYRLGKKIEELFGKDTKDEYYRQLENHEIYSHDESALGKPYCVAIDLQPFILNGDKDLGGSSSAPNHLESFCGTYVNLIFTIAGQFAGAVADVSFLTYFDYFARKEYGDNYLETHKKNIENYLQQVVYTLNDPAVGRGCQAVFYNTSIFDKNYFDGLFSDVIFSDGTNPIWESVDKLQRFFMKWFNKERERAVLTFPVITVAMQTKDGKVKDEEFKNFVAQEMSEGNSFFIYTSDSVDSLASCCRLRNEIHKDNTFAYTLGGTGIATGSKKVFTININRLVQDEANNKNRNLVDDIKKIHKYLYAYDCLLRESEKKHMLPVYDAGFISLDKQYLTIGINGVVEGAEFLGYKISDNDDYKNWLKNILKSIKDCNTEESAYYSKLSGNKISFNTEFVPAENLGVKNAKWDKKDGYKVNRDCYNSYMYLVEDDIDIFDKFNLHGKDIIQYLDGGSAYHMNLAECPTKGTWLKIIDYSTKVGCNYWTYNVKSTYCEDCGYINKETKGYCTKCGSKNVSYLTRVIGYLKKVNSFSKERQKEENTRFYS